MAPTASIFPTGSGYDFTTTQITAGEDISFNGYGLQNDNISVYRTTWGTPEIRYSEVQKPRSNGDIFISRFFGGRQFTISLYAKNCTSESAFQGVIDSLNKNVLNQKDKYFTYLERDGTYRKIKCTCTNISYVREHWNNTHQNIELTFNATEPFFSNLYDESETYENIVTDGAFAEFSHPGTGEKSLPIVYVIFNSAAGVTEWKLRGVDLHAENDYEMVVSGAVTGDVFCINSQDYTFTKNGVSTNTGFDGTFPELYNDPTQFYFESNGTHDVTITLIYPVTYL